MIRRLRIFLLCLLMAALPLQGLAAVMKAACGPAHHQTTVAGAASHHDHGHDAHAHHGHHQVAPDFVAAADDPDKVSDQAGTPGPVAGTCSACAACCTGAVGPPLATASTSSQSASVSAAPIASPWLAGVIPAGLERPPRSPSA